MGLKLVAVELGRLPGYRIYCDGSIWSNKRGGEWRRKATRLNNCGYPIVEIHANGLQRTMSVHALVAEAFLGPRPEGKEVRHVDGNPKNNNAANLAYGTHLENMADRKKHGRFVNINKGEKNGGAKLTERSVKLIRKLKKQGLSFKKLSSRFNVHCVTIQDIVYRNSWKHVK